MRTILTALLIAGLFSCCPVVSAAEIPPASAQALKTVNLAVRNMTCRMCPITVRKALEQVDGVKEARVDYDAKTASVTFDPAKTTIDALTRATTEAGYPSTLKSE